VIIVAAVLVAPLFAIIGGPPSGTAAVESELELSPVSITTEGYMRVDPGQEVTAIFTFTNKSGTSALSKRILAAGRGPGMCQRDWNRAPAASFPALENVILKDKETLRYEKVRAFETPGVYRIEPKRQTLDAGWNGFDSGSQGKYIIVGDESSVKSFNTKCITPLPQMPSPIPGTTTPTAAPKSQSTPTP
jgi:hypothetical protein